MILASGTVSWLCCLRWLIIRQRSVMEITGTVAGQTTLALLVVVLGTENVFYGLFLTN